MEDWGMREEEEEVEDSWWTGPNLMEAMPGTVRAMVGAAWMGKKGLLFCLTNKRSMTVTRPNKYTFFW